MSRDISPWSVGTKSAFAIFETDAIRIRVVGNLALPFDVRLCEQDHCEGKMSDASGVTAFLHFYKIYHLDKFGKIKKSALVMAADDADGLQKARALATDHEVEVWDRSRYVGTIESAEGRSALASEALAAQSLTTAAATIRAA